MRSIESLLDEIATEAAEDLPLPERTDLPPLRYELEYVRGEDGVLRIYEGDGPPDSWEDSEYFDCYFHQDKAVGHQFCEKCQVDYCQHPTCVEQHARMHAKEA